MWTLEHSLELLRMFQPIAHSQGYCLALGGGVLNNGASDHDLDIVVHEMSHPVGEPNLKQFLQRLCEEYPGNISFQGITEEGPHMLVHLGWNPGNKLIEFWFVEHSRV